MSFYSVEELKKLGIKLNNPRNILVSKKISMYNTHLMEFGNNIRIDDFAILSGKIKIGNFVHIASYVGLYANENQINIEDFVSISSKVNIFSSSDDYSGEYLANPTIPNQFKNITCNEINIKKHSMIGASSVILPTSFGLEEGVSVGAMSLVMRKTQPWGIYFGIPARKIANRNRNVLNLEKELMQSMGGGEERI